MFDQTTIIGVSGAAIILVAFVLNQTGKLSSDSRAYDVINSIGSLCLIWYACLLKSTPFIVLNSVWFLVSTWDVIKSFRSRG